MANYGIAQTDEIVIVIGPSGSGKSTFIDYAMGGKGEGIGHGVKSCTTEVTVRKTILGTPPRSIAFVDTPGVDSTSAIDLVALANIADFLTQVHNKGFRTGRILYLHRISDNRIVILPTKVLELLASMCNNFSMPSAVVVATMWSLVKEDIANQRLDELKDMMKSTSFPVPGVTKFQDNMESVCEIVLSQLPSPTKTAGTRGRPRAVVEEEEVIIVMGPTGSGKSTFIDYAIGGNGEGIGHGIKSRTNEITTYKKTLGDTPRTITFVDTPGVDDASDFGNLGTVAEYCGNIRKSGHRLSKILYLHRISDNRVTTSPVETLKLFAHLLGNHDIPAVIIVTTMWSIVQVHIGQDRLIELKSIFGERMKRTECDFVEFKDTSDSAREISLMSPSHSPSVTDNPRITLGNQLEDLIKERKETTRQLKELTGRRETLTLKAQVDKLDKLIAQLIEKVLRLGLNLPEAAKKWLSKSQPLNGQDSTRGLD
ncbi:hypothetical protein FRB91_005199 [Serendipita sp. 411]|nr:hypothetical protein FRB91_005199 [Serendipita sp. 411]